MATGNIRLSLTSRIPSNWLFPLFNLNSNTIQDIRNSLTIIQSLGMGQSTKTNEFSEKFQMAFDPPPPTPTSFPENYEAFFLENVQNSRI